MIICLDIVGIREEIHGHMIRDAIEQTLLTLMPRRRNPVFIEVEIAEDEDLAPAKAMVHEEQEDYFFMSIAKGVLEDPEELIQTVTHETIHIKQYLRGECKDITADKKKWNGTIIDLNEVNYYDLPWEVEAYTLELFLSNSVKQKYNVG